MIKKTVEVLAPAGSMEALVAALAAGADAIYCAGQAFGARAYATNFDNEQMKQAVQLVHQYNAKLYVTMNTLIYEDEIEEALKQVDYYYSIGIDALLIQDLGLFSLIRHRYPDFDLHCSTQMNIHDVNGVKFMKSLGATRVVLARECDQQMVRECCKQGIEIEVFAYGALCSSYSGQCYISAYSQHRSGNRGACGQNCRLDYKMYSDANCVDNSVNPYVLSLQDLNLIEHVDEMIADGVSSLKIEGRMKSSAYVYYITSLFVQAKNAALNNKKFKLSRQQKDIAALLFNRGFSLGYYYHAKDQQIRAMNRPNHIGVPLGKVVAIKPKSIIVDLCSDINQHDGCRLLHQGNDQGIYAHTIKVNGNYVDHASANTRVELVADVQASINDVVVKTSSKVVLDSLQQAIEDHSSRIGLDVNVHISDDGSITISLIDEYDRKCTYHSSIKAEVAQNKAFDLNSWSKVFSKIKETPFYLKDLSYNGGNWFLPMSQANAIRREAIQAFLDSLHSFRTNLAIKDFPVFHHNFDKPTGLVWQEVDGLENRFKQCPLCSQSGNYGQVVGPLIHLTNENNSYTYIQYVGDINDHLQHSLGFIPVTNSYTLQLLLTKKVIPTLSYECSIEQIQSIIDSYTQRNQQEPVCYQFMYGTYRLMSMRDCFVKTVLNKPLHCQYCHQHDVTISDKVGNTYRVEGDCNCVLHLYSTDMRENELQKCCSPLIQWL